GFDLLHLLPRGNVDVERLLDAPLFFGRRLEQIDPKGITRDLGGFRQLRAHQTLRLWHEDVQRLGVGLGALAAAFMRDELIEKREQIRLAARASEIRGVLAVDDQQRYRIHAIAAIEEIRTLQLRFDRERRERFLEVLRADAVLLEEGGNLVDGVQVIAVHVNLAKDERVELIELAERLDRIEEPRVDSERIVPHRRDADEPDDRGRLLPPRLERRVEREAVSAPVPKHLRHFDLARRDVRRLRGYDLLIVRPFLEAARRRRAGGCRAETHGRLGRPSFGLRRRIVFGL